VNTVVRGGVVGYDVATGEEGRKYRSLCLHRCHVEFEYDEE